MPLDYKPELFRPDDTIEQLGAGRLNQILRSPYQDIVGDGDADVQFFNQRVGIQGRGNRGQPQRPAVIQYTADFMVVSEQDDYVTCAIWQVLYDPNGFVDPQIYDPNVTTPDYTYLIAKPYLLQKTPWQGQSAVVNGVTIGNFNYTSVGQRDLILSGANPVHQFIVPNYMPGDIIKAGRCITAVINPDSTGPDIVWLDLNTGGRIWSNRKWTDQGGGAGSGAAVLQLTSLSYVGNYLFPAVNITPYWSNAGSGNPYLAPNTPDSYLQPPNAWLTPTFDTSKLYIAAFGGVFVGNYTDGHPVYAWLGNEVNVICKPDGTVAPVIV